MPAESAQFWQTVLASSSVPTIIIALIAAWQNYQKRKTDKADKAAEAERAKPKTSAETRAIDIASMERVIGNLNAEIDRMKAAELKRDERDKEREKRLSDAESRIDELEALDEARDRLQRKHHEWDELAVGMIRSVIPPLHLPDPPPLDIDQTPRPGEPAGPQQ